jgi:hypothetical protein
VIGRFPIRLNTIILGFIVEPDVQPRHASSRSAKPNRLATDSTTHRLADRLPKGVLLKLGSVSDERSQVSISRVRRARAWNNHARVSAKVGKDNDPRTRSVFEVFGKRLWVGTARQTWAFEEYEFERPSERVQGYGRRLPSESRVRGLCKRSAEMQAEFCVEPPSVQDFLESCWLSIELYIELLTAMVGDRVASETPHVKLSSVKKNVCASLRLGVRPTPMQVSSSSSASLLVPEGSEG